MTYIYHSPPTLPRASVLFQIFLSVSNYNNQVIEEFEKSNIILAVEKSGLHDREGSVAEMMIDNTQTI